MISKTALLSILASAASAQQVGTLTAETHPPLPIQSCTAAGCTSLSTSITLDANWRWLHTTTGSTNCYTGNKWDTTICPNGSTCAAACALDGADYPGTYGITASGNALTLKFVTKGPYSTNIGSRNYLMAPGSQDKYQMFKLLNREFTLDVDVSNLPCGLNGALYLVEMEEDGGKARFPTNKAGAKYGTGYCDTQCPHDIKFINGEANTEGWTGSANDANAGAGKYGSCCHEMDLWEANSISTAYTPHVCSANGQIRCSGTECGDGDLRYSGICDKDGCDFNSYRQGDKGFYGPGLTVDTKKKFTVVTQFVTKDGTDTGALSEIRRLYVQNGVVIKNSVNKVAGIPATDAISDDFCAKQKTAFGDNNHFAALGGLATMGGALSRGMVLSLSIWDDHAVNMLWLDSTFPVTADPAKPGVARGTCSTSSGVPSELELNSPDSSVVYSNIKFGAIGSTYGNLPVPGSSSVAGTPSSTKTSTTLKTSTVAPTTIKTSTVAPTTIKTSATPSASSVGVSKKYEQCGGEQWKGPTVCEAGSTCTRASQYYSQCL